MEYLLREICARADLKTRFYVDMAVRIAARSDLLPSSE